MTKLTILSLFLVSFSPLLLQACNNHEFGFDGPCLNVCKKLSLLHRKLRSAKLAVAGALRASLLLVGAGIGLLVGYWPDTAFDMEEVAYFSMIFIMGGAGLGLAYFIEEGKARKQQ